MLHYNVFACAVVGVLSIFEIGSTYISFCFNLDISDFHFFIDPKINFFACT